MPVPGRKQSGARAGAALCIREAAETLDGRCSGKVTWEMSVSLPRAHGWGCVSLDSAEREPPAPAGRGLDQAPP